MTDHLKIIWFRDLLRMTRSYNLLIILVTQLFVYIFLLGDGFHQIYASMDPSFFLLSIATIMVAAAGYIINDYHDVKIDMINKPTRVVVGNAIKRRIALLLYFLLSSAGVAIGFMLSWQIGLINVFSATLLWLYSIRFKRIVFWGNFSIAVLTALSILIIYIWRPFESGFLLLAYAWYAFIITLIREIIKDMEDMRGDSADGCKTLPIVYGIRKTIKVIYILNTLMIITVVAGLVFSDILVVKIFALLVTIQLIYLTLRLSKTDTIIGFRQLGKYCKLIMLTGILAMLFF